MAIIQTNREYCACQNDYKYEYLCDTEEDVSNLPTCCTGSTALVCSTGNVYVVNASGEWVLFGQEGGSMATQQHLYRYDLLISNDPEDFVVSFTIFSAQPREFNSYDDVFTAIPEGNRILASGVCGGEKATIISFDDSDCFSIGKSFESETFSVSTNGFVILAKDEMQIF